VILAGLPGVVLAAEPGVMVTAAGEEVGRGVEFPGQMTVV
jgi:hypothetical protein